MTKASRFNDRIGDGLSTECTIVWEVTHVYSLSSLLYFICGEVIVREGIDNLQTGVSTGGRIVNTVRHVDDSALMANSKKGLQLLMVNLNCLPESCT